MKRSGQSFILQFEPILQAPVWAWVNSGFFSPRTGLGLTEEPRTVRTLQPRPYHAGSLLGPAPCQVLTTEQQTEWITRLRAYWNRSNAKARDVGRGLLSFLGSDGALFPTLETLAARSKCSIKTVQRWLEAFSDVGFIQVIRRRNLFGQTSNAYLIRFPHLGSSDPAPVGEQLSFYNAGKDSDKEVSMDSLPTAGRPAALRRLNSWLGAIVEAVRPAPHPPRYTPEQQIALLQDRLALE